MRKLLFWMVIMLCAPSWALAWGDVGHRAVAEIATFYLDVRARAAVERLLVGGMREFVEVASWADEVAYGEWPESLPWHAVDIPHDSVGYDRERDCPNDDCIVEQIKRFAAVLADPKTAKDERSVALKMVIHLVGDLHVPLHAYVPDWSWDGWEGPWLDIDGEVDQFHMWWDEGFVFLIGPDATEIATELVAATTAEEVSTWKQSTPEDWANESFLLARDFVIRHELIDVLSTVTEESPMVLRPSILDEVQAIVARRLRMAGIRLAMLLNTAFREHDFDR